MELIFSVLLFSISSNLDNIVIGFAYALKKIRIGILPNIIIAIVTSTGTFLSMSAGNYITNFLSDQVANILGTGALMILGIYFVIQSIVKLIKNTRSKELSLKNIDDMIEYAQKSDLDSSGDIDIKEAFLVGLGLTFNNIGTGIVASITGVNISLTVVATFILSMFAIICGESVGNHILGKFLGKYAPLISGILLIILSIVKFFKLSL